MKGLTIAQWINHNQNNISVLACQYSVLWEQSWRYPPISSGLTAGRQADHQMKYGWASKFAFILFIITAMLLELHFSQLL